MPHGASRTPRSVGHGVPPKQPTSVPGGIASAASSAAPAGAAAALLVLAFVLAVPTLIRRLRASLPRARPPMLVALLERPG